MSAWLERVRAALAPKGYDVERELASGGMGTVFLARDVRLDGPVAIKVLRPGLWTVASAQQFVEEARTLRRLQHHNIVPVHDVDESHGLNFYVMDFLAGDTVESHLTKRGPLSLDAGRKLGRDLLEALGVSHRAGVIHRDVKPANVFWDGKKGVLTDFGIARHLTKEELSDPGILRGTAGYMAPELFAGFEADECTDVYAAGMVIYEALTGRCWEKTPPRAGNWTGVPFLIGRVLRKALELDRGPRWRDASAFKSALWRTRVRTFQFRAALLTVAGLVVGAAAAARLVGRAREGMWPFHPSASVELFVTPFDTVATRGSAVAAGLAGALAHKLAGYPDFSIHGPGLPPLLRRNAALVLRGVVRGAEDALHVELLIRAGTRAGQPSVISVAGDARHPDGLVDSLAFGVVRAIWNRDNPMDPSLPVAALPRTTSGLAAWLAAERLFAAARWGAADSAYAAAETIDSTCRLCYWRHRVVQQWLNRDPDPALTAHYLPNLRFFPPRYQSLMRAVTLSLRARLDTLRRVTGQWGDFFPAWFQLADELYHRGPLVGYGRAEAVEAFQRTERLGPAFGPSLEHLTWALTAEGDSSAAWAEWRKLEALGTPTDAFTVSLRALLRVGFAFRFEDSTAARRVLDSALAGEGIQHFPGLAAGPRYLATFDAPIGAVVMGRLFAASPDRGLQRSGLEAAAFGLVSLGQLGAARAELARLRDRFDAADLRLLEPELDGALLLVGIETADPASDWSRVAETLSRDADARSTTSEAGRRRAGWLLSLAARRWGGADTTRYHALLAGEPFPQPLGRLLAADALARHGRYTEALQASDPLRELEAPVLSGATSGDPIFRTMLHMLRAAWSRAAGQSRAATAQELLWYQNNDVSGYPTGDPQVGDVDWAFGTLARWRRATLLEGDRHDEACHAFRDVARLWSRGDPPFRARADSAARRLVTLRCKAAA